MTTSFTYIPKARLQKLFILYMYNVQCPSDWIPSKHEINKVKQYSGQIPGMGNVLRILMQAWKVAILEAQVWKDLPVKKQVINTFAKTSFSRGSVSCDTPSHTPFTAAWPTVWCVIRLLKWHIQMSARMQYRFRFVFCFSISTTAKNSFIDTPWPWGQ